LGPRSWISDAVGSEAGVTWAIARAVLRVDAWKVSEASAWCDVDIRRIVGIRLFLSGVKEILWCVVDAAFSQRI
jgi:hypothetical protein